MPGAICLPSSRPSIRLPGVVRLLIASLLITAVWSPAAFAEEDEPWQDETAALQIDAKTTKGLRYSGRILRSDAMMKLFPGEKAPDLAEVDADGSILISGFNGLSGSIRLKLGELASIQVVGPLDKETISSDKDARQAAMESRWATERARLAAIDAGRNARKQAELAAAAATTGALPELSQASAQWMNSYPPEEGWVPAKKAQLYYQTVVVDNRPLTDDERNWLDNYDAWKLAYDEWLALEQARAALDQAGAQQSGSATTPGSAESTAKSAAAAIDPASDGQAGAGMPKVQPIGSGPSKGDPSGGR